MAHLLMAFKKKITYVYKKKKKVCNKYRTSHNFFFFLFIALIYFTQEYIPLDRGMCILAKNKLVQ